MSPNESVLVWYLGDPRSPTDPPKIYKVRTITNTGGHPSFVGFAELWTHSSQSAGNPSCEIAMQYCVGSSELEELGDEPPNGTRNVRLKMQRKTVKLRPIIGLKRFELAQIANASVLFFGTGLNWFVLV